jgi:quercetin dioxygenase-like cupin family protein
MSIYVRKEDIKRREMRTLSKVPLITEVVYGTNASLIVGYRPPGYHSKPHKHDCEQLNYVLSGELWLFIEEESYKLKAGDYLRVPPNKVHWSWNKGTETSVLVEVHSPGLQDDWKDIAVPLFYEGEITQKTALPHNIMVDVNQNFIDRVEKPAREA